MKKYGLALVFVSVLAVLARAADRAHVPYVWATATHIRPDTHNQESGYFSLCEGLDGKVYVGATKYGVNSFLVQIDPATAPENGQRIVADTHKLCGVRAAGFAAQSKIHTPNFVGPSGRIYFGSKQGYPEPGDTQKFPGGFVMTYDPARDEARSLGMPLPGYGVGDAVVDEARDLLYVVAERVEPDQPMRWLVADLGGKRYRELGAEPTRCATTLIDAHGRAHTLDKQFRLAQYDPRDGRIRLRDHPLPLHAAADRVAGISTLTLPAGGGGSVQRTERAKPDGVYPVSLLNTRLK